MTTLIDDPIVKAKVAAIYREHDVDGVQCYCDVCRMAREIDQSLYNRPKCAECGTEKRWDGFDCRYVVACACNGEAK